MYKTADVELNLEVSTDEHNVIVCKWGEKQTPKTIIEKLDYYLLSQREIITDWPSLITSKSEAL